MSEEGKPYSFKKWLHDKSKEKHISGPRQYTYRQRRKIRKHITEEQWEALSEDAKEAWEY